MVGLNKPLDRFSWVTLSEPSHVHRDIYNSQISAWLPVQEMLPEDVKDSYRFLKEVTYQIVAYTITKYYI